MSCCFGWLHRKGGLKKDDILGEESGRILKIFNTKRSQYIDAVVKYFWNNYRLILAFLDFLTLINPIDY